jgi:hypothetical protein
VSPDAGSKQPGAFLEHGNFYRPIVSLALLMIFP